VFDADRKFVDGSRNVLSLPDLVSDSTREAPVTVDLTWNEAPWRITQRVLRPNVAPPTSGGPEPNHNGEPDKPRYKKLVLVVAAPLNPVHRSLRKLAIVLMLLSLGLWAAAALAGRWLCRRALSPVSRMAQAAREMSVAQLNRRLPEPDAADELQALAHAFNDLLSRLQDSFERQRRFTGEASHQLRTPLTAMLGQVEVALRRDRPPEEYRGALSAVQQQCERMRQILEMLLFLAQADADATLPEFQVVELSDWLTQHLKDWQQHPRHNDLRWEANGDLRVNVHPGLLAQALDNLLDNACKYSPPSSPIHVRANRDGAEALIVVEDQGFGIATEELPHLFDPFFRAADVRRRGITGVGLGLAVSARIISSFGGRIDVSSEPGKGSRFVIRLPLADAIESSKM
ncbi:MAG TPA: ATP-binding protein, partial [Gemmataceae bacterium]|nr:ATP-binding protein [Gemmataceae bacterium]